MAMLHYGCTLTVIKLVFWGVGNDAFGNLIEKTIIRQLVSMQSENHRAAVSVWG